MQPAASPATRLPGWRTTGSLSACCSSTRLGASPGACRSSGPACRTASSLSSGPVSPDGVVFCAASCAVYPAACQLYCPVVSLHSRRVSPDGVVPCSIPAADPLSAFSAAQPDPLVPSPTAGFLHSCLPSPRNSVSSLTFLPACSSIPLSYTDITLLPPSATPHSSP